MRVQAAEGWRGPVGMTWSPALLQQASLHNYRRVCALVPLTAGLGVFAPHLDLWLRLLAAACHSVDWILLLVAISVTLLLQIIL